MARVNTSMYYGNHAKGEIEITKENIVFENKYATFFNDDVIFPNGSTGQHVRMTWNAPYGVITLPTDANGNALLIRNFRHDTRRWSWDIPQGFGEPGLTPEECAAKEIEEETGCKTKDLTLFKTLNHSRYKTYIYDAIVEGTPSVSGKEAEETISEARFFTQQELEALLKSEHAGDPMTLFFILRCIHLSS